MIIGIALAILGMVASWTSMMVYHLWTKVITIKVRRIAFAFAQERAWFTRRGV